MFVKANHFKSQTLGTFKSFCLGLRTSGHFNSFLVSCGNNETIYCQRLRVFLARRSCLGCEVGKSALKIILVEENFSVEWITRRWALKAKRWIICPSSEGGQYSMSNETELKFIISKLFSNEYFVSCFLSLSLCLCLCLTHTNIHRYARTHV